MFLEQIIKFSETGMFHEAKPSNEFSSGDTSELF